MIIFFICFLFYRLCVFFIDVVLYRIFVLYVYVLLFLFISYLFFYRILGYGFLVVGLFNLIEINFLLLERFGVGYIVIFYNFEFCYIVLLMFKFIISNYEK